MKRALPACLIVVGIIAVLGNVFTGSSVDTWYAALEKPGWTPPNWLFGPVWTALYVMLAFAGALLWPHTSTVAGKKAFAFWCLQLGLNLLWSAVFFGLRAPGWAFAEIVVLLFAIGAAMHAALPLSRPAAYLYAPYLAWVLFASALNFAIWLETLV